MKVKLSVDRIHAAETTENWTAWPFSNTRDEVYLVAVGTTEYIYRDRTSGRVERRRSQDISIPRISPSGREDYYGLANGDAVSGVAVKEWDLDLTEDATSGEAFGHRFYVDVILREQDNAQLGAIKELVKSLFSDGVPTSEDDAADVILSGTNQLLRSFFSDGDETIGGFRAVCYAGLPAQQRPPFMSSMFWKPLDGNTQLVAGVPSLSNGWHYDMSVPARSSVEFAARGAGADYRLMASIEVSGDRT